MGKADMSAEQAKVTASVYSDKDSPIDPRLVKAVRTAELELGMKVFCLIQHGTGDERYGEIHPWLTSRVMASVGSLPPGQSIAVLLHSPGGDAHTAFRLARFLRRHCQGYTVIIPRYAKSAATLFSLGASDIYFGDYAEFGPIDVQLDNAEQERTISALEVVQSLERLNSEALLAVDSMMTHLMRRSQKKVDALLPAVLRYAADLTKPMFDKIDTVSFTFHARLLKIGEDYARMLLRHSYRPEIADTIAYSLTRKYPDHGFVIDCDEAKAIGLELQRLPDKLREPLALQRGFLDLLAEPPLGRGRKHG